jgi:hypothetical protein
MFRLQSARRAPVGTWSQRTYLCSCGAANYPTTWVSYPCRRPCMLLPHLGTSPLAVPALPPGWPRRAPCTYVLVRGTRTPSHRHCRCHCKCHCQVLPLRQTRKSPIPVPRFPIWPGNREGAPFPTRPESGIGKSPVSRRVGRETVTGIGAPISRKSLANRERFSPGGRGYPACVHMPVSSR